MPHASKDEIPPQRVGDYEGRLQQFGDNYYANFEIVPAGFGGTDFFKGLPDDTCQAEHWGFIFKGKVKFTYTDGSEDVISAGEAYYAHPGHVYEVLEDAETLEFSPREEMDRTMEAVSRNVEAMGNS